MSWRQEDRMSAGPCARPAGRNDSTGQKRLRINNLSTNGERKHEELAELVKRRTGGATMGDGASDSSNIQEFKAHGGSPASAFRLPQPPGARSFQHAFRHLFRRSQYR